MQNYLLPVARRFWRNVDSLTPLARITGVGDMLGTFYTLPLALGGLVWLAFSTNTHIFTEHSLMMAVIFGLLYVFTRLSFFIINEIRAGVFADFDGSLEPIITFGAVLMFGPSVMWLNITWIMIYAIREWLRAQTVAANWNIVRNTAMEVCQHTIMILLASMLYEYSGGVYPLPNFEFQNMLRAFFAMGIWLGGTTLLYVPLIWYWNNSIRQQGSGGSFFFFFSMMISWPIIIAPFGILAAGIHTAYGLSGYAFLMGGLVLTALLAHELSRAVETSRRRSVELEKLEALGRAILNAPPDASTLSDLLRVYVGSMFQPGRVEIRIFPDDILLRQPDEPMPELQGAWSWLRAQDQVAYFQRRAVLPWSDRPCEHALVIAPITDIDEPDQVIGGISIASESLLVRRDPGSGADIIPAVQSLASQISSAMQRAHAYNRMLSSQRMVQELELAGRIQQSFLPDQVPRIKGWEISATLESARQTSGDFYDLIGLPDGKLGIVVADVADKGMGAALFMAMCRTLIRTYAHEYVAWPEIALQAANHRIVKDTEADVFVTVFYAVLDPATGTLTYCNAGHNPPYVMRRRNSKHGTISRLTRTGVPLGLFEEYNGKAATVELEPGDTLIVYTDGITEARSPDGEEFGDPALQQVIIRNRWRPAREMHHAITRALQHFQKGAPLHDDLTLLVAVRNA